MVLVFVSGATFEDLIQGDFNNGTYFQTEWNSSDSFVWLAPANTSGNFTSQIFNAGGSTTWNNISWFTEVPYNQELPDNQAVETGDFLRGANMTGNVLLLHFNNDSAYGENDTHVYDFSGNGNNGTVLSGNATWTSSGKLGEGAFEFDGTNDVIKTSNTVGNMGIDGSNNQTISFWAYPKPTSGKDNKMAVIFIPEPFAAPDTSQSFFIALYESSTIRIGQWGDDTDTGISYNDNEWIQIAVTYNGTSYELYKNGIFVYSFVKAKNLNISYVPYFGTSLVWGGHDYNGTIDEVAIWNRSLSSQEVLDIYKRGALRLNLSVQSCNDASCDGESWTNLGNNLTSPQELSVDNNTYFQYKYDFETDNASYSPELYNVSLDYALTANPVVNISLVYPTTNISVYKNKFFNFTVNVSCFETNCGEINVSLDPVVNWWNSSFAKRKEINITNVGSTTLTDFPAYLNITYNESMQADFDDLRFISGNCEDDSSLELAYEIENYTGMKADVWIKIPSLTTGVNSICMYYNNSGVGGGENVTGVWDDNYEGVWHMSETGTGTRFDSTQYARDCTPQNYDNDESTKGQIDGADEFEGTDDFLDCGGNIDATTKLTIEYWMYGHPSTTSIFVSKTNAASQIFYLGEWSNTFYFWASQDGGTSSRQYYSASAVPSDNTWHHIVAVYDESGGIFDMYIDGSKNTGGGSAGNIASIYSDNTVNFTIGRRDTGTSYYYDGIGDEVRISNTSRSADWINQSYQLVKNPGTYVVFGSEEDYSASGKGIISTVAGTTPFYTNKSSNPYNISLNAGESELVTFWVNATGNYGASYNFFAYVNMTSNMSIGSISDTLNITIISNPISISNSVQSPETPTNYVGTYQFNITVNDYDVDFDTIYFSWNSEANQSIVTYRDINGSSREYYHSEVTPTTGNDIPFAWFVNDSEGNVDTSSGTYTISAVQTSASLTLDKIISLNELNATDIIYNITLRVTNKGGSDATSVVLVDSDSSASPYDLGTLGEGEINSTSYLKTYSRNSTSYNVSLAIASVNGTDSYQDNDTSANSSEIVLVVPGTQTSAQFVLDKIVTIQNMTNTTINYNISLRVVNKGGSDATSVNLTDSDSLVDSYDLTTVGANSSVVRSYVKSYTRNSTTYNASLVQARVNGIDSYSGNEIETNSSSVVLAIPATTASQQLTLIKNVYYNSENATAVNYTVSVEVVNSGGVDLSTISLIDNDLDINTNINLNRTQNYSSSDSILIDKAASNTNKLFVKASATVNSVTYQSNQIQVRIPGYGGPADAIVAAPASVQTSTSFDTTITVENQNPDIGQDFTIEYWITNVAEDTNYTSGEQTIYVSASNSSDLTASLTSPSDAGDYRYRAIVIWAGGSATAYDSFSVTAPVADSRDTESSGGGGTTGKVIYEVDDEDISKGKTRFLRDGEKIKFNVVQKDENGEKMSEEHSLEIIDLKSDSALITIYSEPISFRLNVYEDKKIDLNEDGYSDLYVRLDKIEKNRAYVYLKSIYEEIEVGDEISDEGDEVIDEELSSAKPKWFLKMWQKIKLYSGISWDYVLNNKIYFVYFGAGILVVLIILILIKLIRGKGKKTRKSKYSKNKIKYLQSKIKHLEKLEKRKEKENKLKEKIKKLKSKTFLISLFSLGLVWILSLSKGEITGFAINNSDLIVKSLINVLYFAFLIGILGLFIFIHRHNIEKVKSKMKNKIKNK